MKINYHGRKFAGVENTANGQVDGDTLFEYQQRGQTLTAKYAGGSIRQGFMLGKVFEDGSIEFAYHHLDTDDVLKNGFCQSKPEWLPDGRIRLYETWHWTHGGDGNGSSIVEEIKD